MTTLGLTMAGRERRARSIHSSTTMRQVLLGCGVLSSLLYLATDVLGGLWYEGYSFTSQAISELMAVGAPSESLVDPLFLIYGVLAVAFGAGVWREGTQQIRLRFIGALLIVYGIIGLTGPLFFEMSQRGAAAGNDLGHIILTGALVLLLLLTVGIGAFAFGERFRAYSLATLVIVIGFGTLSAQFVSQLAAGQPTPGLGIIERVHVYAFLLWVALFAIALLRRPGISPQPPVQ